MVLQLCKSAGGVEIKDGAHKGNESSSCAIIRNNMQGMLMRAHNIMNDEFHESKGVIRDKSSTK